MNRRAWIAIGLLAAVSTTGVLLTRRHQQADAATVALDWPMGTRDTYSLVWRSQDAATAPGTDHPMTGEVELAAELAITSLGRRGDVYWLHAGLQEVRQHRVVVMGEEILADEEKAR